MKIKAIVYSVSDNYNDTVYQLVKINDRKCFSVCNLSNCPEYAMIGRDLFDADDYLKAIKFGMNLAKQGYDDIQIEFKKSNE